MFIVTIYETRLQRSLVLTVLIVQSICFSSCYKNQYYRKYLGVSCLSNGAYETTFGFGVSYAHLCFLKYIYEYKLIHKTTNKFKHQLSIDPFLTKSMIKTC